MSNNKKVKEGCEESDRRERVLKITALLNDVKYDDQETKDAAILSFAKSAMRLEDVEFISKTLKADYRADHAKTTGVF